MSSLREKILESRRDFMTSSASGLGGIALTTMLAEKGLLGQASAAGGMGQQMMSTHFPAKAKSCIFLFMAGAPSQIDLFDPKPKLTELNGYQRAAQEGRYAYQHRLTAYRVPQTVRRHFQEGVASTLRVDFR